MPRGTVSGSFACFRAGGAAAIATLAVWGVLALVAGCQRTAHVTPASPRVSATPEGLEIEFTEPVELARVELWGTDADPLVTWPTAGARRRFVWPVAWPPGGPWRLRIVPLGGAPWEYPLARPPASRPLAVQIEAPAGTPAMTLAAGAPAVIRLPAQARAPLAVRVVQQVQRPLAWTLILKGPAAGHVLDGGSLRQEMNGEWQWAESSSVADEYRRTVVEWSPPGEAAELTLELRWRALPGGADAESAERDQPAADAVAGGLPVDEVVESYSLRLVAADPDALARQLVLTAWELPVVRTGGAGGVGFDVDATRPRETLYLSGGWWQWLREHWPGSWQLSHPHEPAGWQGLALRNSGPTPLDLLVETAVVGPDDLEPRPEFGPPAWLAPRGGATVDGWLRVPAGGEAAVVLPVYVGRQTTAGSYRRMCRVRCAGVEAPLLTATAPLEVRATGGWASAITGLVLAATPLVWLGAAWGARRWSARLSNDTLATIGLLAGLQFVVSAGSRLVGDVLAGVLGPLAIFVASLGSEGVLTGLAAVAVLLGPRPGTLALSYAAVFLLNAVFTGHLGWVDLVFLTVSIGWSEGLAALFGVTRGTGSVGDRPDGAGRAARLALVARVALALGLANAATLATQYALQQVLYRLYFADWYVAAVALVTGLLYGGLGAAWGTRLGLRLRRSVA